VIYRLPPLNALRVFEAAAELYALEREARRLRAAEISRLFRVAANRWNALWAPRATKGLHHA
jgi:hypothetical protein